MEPVSIVVICAVAFGSVVALSSFVRQLLISRDKKLNDEAQHRALLTEANELEKMRLQMESRKRFKSHYKLLGSNKDAISYLDNKIEDVLQQKSRLIERYGQMMLKESSSIIENGPVAERKKHCDQLREELSNEIEFYNHELAALQKRRAGLWDTHAQLQEQLIQQEASRNTALDSIYQKQAGILEKMYLRHVDDSETIAKETIYAGNMTFKDMLMAPIEFLRQYFSPLSNITGQQASKENAHRDEVAALENEINEEFSDSPDVAKAEDKQSEASFLNSMLDFA